MNLKWKAGVLTVLMTGSIALAQGASAQPVATTTRGGRVSPRKVPSSWKIELKASRVIHGFSL